MSYATAIEQLNAMAPELYTAQGQERRKFSLDEVRTLLEALGNPQRAFASVLIAGTNGKGSTASTLASILKGCGVRVGLYTSPHLERVNERIRVDGAEIADEAFAASYFRVHDTAQWLVREGLLPRLPSFFEMVTAQGFMTFAGQGVEMAVLEVGMGGRLDATNVVEPLLSVVTDISLDHTEWLGSTIAAITREKAGILRPGGTLITLPQHPEANQVLDEVASALGVRGVSAVPYMPPAGASATGAYTVEVLGAAVEVDSPLKGAHQQRNAALAMAAAVELSSLRGLPITPESMAVGIRQTRWPGRLERLRRGGMEWILDVAHNPAGAWALRAGLGALLGGSRPRALIFSCLRDKPVREMAEILFPLFEEVILAPLHAARAAAVEDLREAAEAVGTPAVAAASIQDALHLALRDGGGGTVVVSGSVYLVGEMRSLLLCEGAER